MLLAEEHVHTRTATYLDGLSIKLETLLLVGEELLDILALIALKLDHLSHLSIDDNGAIASCYEILAESCPNQGR